MEKLGDRTDQRYLIVGRATLDVSVYCRDEGQAAGELELLSGYRVGAGGSGVNTAIALADLGGEVALSTRVGRDLGGEVVRSELARRRVRVVGATDDSSRSTAFSVIQVRQKGSMSLLHFEGASKSLELSDVPDNELADCGRIHIAGALLMEKLDGAPTARLLEAARELGKQTSLGTSRNTGKGDVLHSVLPWVDTIFLSEREALELTKSAGVRQAAAWLRGRGVKEVAVTLGAEGAFVADAEGEEKVAPLGVHSRDTTGCGDAFAAGYLHASSRGFSGSECALYGNALGAHCARTLGALVSPVSGSELDGLVSWLRQGVRLGAFVLAGGEGRRMEGSDQKLLLPLKGRPLIAWVVQALRQLGVARLVVLVGHRAEALKAALSSQPVEFYQAPDYGAGSGASVRAALRELDDLPETLVVANGDTPLVSAGSLERLVSQHLAQRAAMTVFTATTPDPQRYAHGIVDRDEAGRPIGIDREISRPRIAPGVAVNTGTYCFSRDQARSCSEALAVASDGKVHLSDMLAVMTSRQLHVQEIPHSSFTEFISVNTRDDLETVERLAGSRGQQG